MHRSSIWTRGLGMVAALPLILMTGSGTLAQSDDATMAPMADLPTWSVTLSGLTPGATVATNEATIDVTPAGYAFDCAAAGTTNIDAIGHYHLILDGSLVDMFCTPSATISLQNIAPGTHTITAVPALNDHEEVLAGAASIDFTYAPTDPLPEIMAEAPAGTPSISITSPAPGTEISGDFSVNVRVDDFELSDALLGKPNVPGYGHWHLNVDSTSGPMMGMATMLGMSGTDTLQASAEYLSPGNHTFYAILVDDQHAPLMPEVVAQVDLVVKPEAAEGAAAGGAAVAIEGFDFHPGKLTVEAGSRVTWTDLDSVNHTVTADDGSFDSGSISNGQAFRQTFDQAGTFTYHCAIHPSMTATIVVTG